MSGKAMIYTSDHGQSLLEGGYAGTHCTVGPNIAVGEALVPLFAITGDAALRTELTAASRRMHNKASHFDIFPTLLMALGYARAEVQAAYGAGLFGEPGGPRRFLSGFKTTAAWVEVA
jgi:lipid A ethanolaminephosphotransferase